MWLNTDHFTYLHTYLNTYIHTYLPKYIPTYLPTIITQWNTYCEILPMTGFQTTDLWCQNWPLCQLSHNQSCKQIVAKKLFAFRCFTVLVPIQWPFLKLPSIQVPAHFRHTPFPISLNGPQLGKERSDQWTILKTLFDFKAWLFCWELP